MVETLGRRSQLCKPNYIAVHGKTMAIGGMLEPDTVGGLRRFRCYSFNMPSGERVDKRITVLIGK